MPILFNGGASPKQVFFNGVEVAKVIFNGVVVWLKETFGPSPEFSDNYFSSKESNSSYYRVHFHPDGNLYWKDEWNDWKVLGQWVTIGDDYDYENYEIQAPEVSYAGWSSSGGQIQFTSTNGGLITMGMVGVDTWHNMRWLTDDDGYNQYDSIALSVKQPGLGEQVSGEVTVVIRNKKDHSLTATTVIELEATAY